MILTFVNRLNILSILPQKGNRITMRIVTDLENKLVITQDEIKKYSFRVSEDGKAYNWNFKLEEEDGGKDFEITDLEKEEVTKALVDLEKKNELDKHLLGLYDDFTAPITNLVKQ